MNREKINKQPPRVFSVLGCSVFFGCSVFSVRATLPAIAIVAAITLLGGCKILFHEFLVARMTAQQYKDQCIFVTRDDFKKTTSVETQLFNFYFKSNSYEGYRLYSVKKDNGNVVYGLDLYTSYGRGWAFWNNAADQNGNEFSMKQLKTIRSESGKTEEWASAQLSREYLESIRKTGITWRFYGRSITAQATILPQIVDGFLMRVDETFKE